MYRTTCFVTLVFLLLFQSSLASGAEQERIDPVAVSPDKYKVLLENAHVRVVEYEIKPGERDNWHTHPAKVSYVVTGGRLKITTADGKSFEVDEDVHSARWFGAVGRHYGENVGDTPVRIVFVEVKDVDAGADDLGRFDGD